MLRIGFASLGKLPPGNFVRDDRSPVVFRIGQCTENMIFFSLVGRQWNRFPIYKCVRGEGVADRFYLYHDDRDGWIVAIGSTTLPLDADLRLLQPHLRLPYWGDDLGYEDPSRPGFYMWQRWMPSSDPRGGQWQEIQDPYEHVEFPESQWDMLIPPCHMDLIVMGQ